MTDKIREETREALKRIRAENVRKKAAERKANGYKESPEPPPVSSPDDYGVGEQHGAPDQAQPQQNTKALALTFFDGLGEPIPKPWLIKNVIARGETSSWIAPPAKGKSALLTDIAIHNAGGQDWRGHRTREPSVPILKFLFNFCVDRECAAAEAFYGGQDIVGCLGPAEGFGVGVASLDIGIDRRFQVRGRAMGATLDLSLGQQRKEPLDLVDP